jgi:hypothetical protein
VLHFLCAGLLTDHEVLSFMCVDKDATNDRGASAAFSETIFLYLEIRKDIRCDKAFIMGFVFGGATAHSQCEAPPTGFEAGIHESHEQQQESPLKEPVLGTSTIFGLILAGVISQEMAWRKLIRRRNFRPPLCIQLNIFSNEGIERAERSQAVSTHCHDRRSGGRSN